MWNGRVVHALRHPVVVTVPSGTPPRMVHAAARELNVGGATVPTPMWWMRHPNMTVAVVDGAPEAGSEAKKCEVRPPVGEQFFAWAPEHATR